MTETIKEYAEALYSLSTEKGKKKEFADEMKVLLDAFSENPEAISALFSPEISFAEKKAFIENAFSGTQEEITDFLLLLAKSGRIKYFDEIAKEYFDIVSRENRVVKAKITSASEMDENEKSRLKKALEKKLNSKVEPTFCVDKSLIGGLKVETDDVVIDGSVKKKLLELKGVID